MDSTSATGPFEEAVLEKLRPALDGLELDFEIAVFERAVASRPDDLDALESLGIACTRRGLYGRGLEVDRRLADLCPANPRIHYNLACSYALTGDADRAIAALSRAIELGYDDRAHLERDHDLDAIRGDRRFVELVERLA